MNHFKPLQPDPFIKKDSDMTPAKFGHLNHIMNLLGDIQEEIETDNVPAAAVANATDEADAVIKLNALLAGLRTAGIIAS